MDSRSIMMNAAMVSSFRWLVVRTAPSESRWHRVMPAARSFPLSLNSRNTDPASCAAQMLNDLGRTEAMRARPAPAVRLMASGAALARIFGFLLAPVDQIEYDRCLATLRDQLTTLAFTSAWKEGQVLGYEEAIAYALGEGVGA